MQEWHRIQGLMPSLSGPGYRRAWAKAANMSLEELEECESQGPLAAHLLLASVERLLYNMALKYGQAVSLLSFCHCFPKTVTAKDVISKILFKACG